VADNGLTPENQASLFYSTIDEQKFAAYFEPFRSRQYRYILKKLGLRPGSSLLDVGASYGWMVRAGVELGLDSCGLEPGVVTSDVNLAKRIERSSLEEYARTTTRRFDVITIWHTLEHLQEPLEAMSQMAQLLNPGGYLVVAVPTTDGWMFRLGLLLQKLLRRPELLNELFYFHNPTSTTTMRNP
jgi:2-polyprenyl-3-methyl-5-hydroxy-6-metoxy-1,4-benzoquinol methylase